MKSVSKSIGILVLGIVIGSLPYTLSVGKTFAQDTSRIKLKHTTPNIEQFEVWNGYVYVLASGKISRISIAKVAEGQWTQAPVVTYR